MITRQLALGRGRIALAKPSSPAWRRALATAVDQHTSSMPTADPVSLDLPSQSASSTRVPQASLRPALDPKYGRFALDYEESQAFRKKTRSLGTHLTPHYRPRELISKPPGPADVTLEALMAAQSHFGHATGLWHPGNARYIYGVRSGIHIISLDVTASHLRRAVKIVRNTTSMGGLVLFVGTRDGQSQSVVRAAELAGGCHLFDRWIPGSITNAHQILAKCRKTVRDMEGNEVPGFEEQLDKHPALKPDLVVVLNPLENYVLLRECRQHNIPTIGVVDTDCNPTWVTYPIPANDDSRRCTNFIAGVLGRAGEEGNKARAGFVAEFGASPHEQGHQLELASDEEGEEGEEDLANPKPSPYEDQEARRIQAINKTRNATSADEDGLLGPVELLDEAQTNAAFYINDLSDESDLATDILAADFIHGPPDHALTDADLTEAESHLTEAGVMVDGSLTSPLIQLTPEEGRRLEALAEEANDEQITEEEAASLIRDANAIASRGLQISMPTVQDTTGSALRKLREAEDPSLARLVAIKRRALGETLSAADLKVLESVEAEEREVRKRVNEKRAETIKQLTEAIAEADEEAKEIELEEADEEDELGMEEYEERQRSRTAHYDDPDEGGIGPIRKNRRGGGGGFER
ncbi:ribosomal protein S2, flavodoxin-like domain-containing protein [Elsinoe ampelina]|uniref:Ribosomal protein S2, flavodoxin-like domain-containing protein n=1 Tax=Elsinoe ampelina TaxID=302913 RepID=A0A6A6GFW0_9PEZI|nr:ribosomal protein S2, flavodoxin-like domain-containing protein [Elsinoe ampelina]